MIRAKESVSTRLFSPGQSLPKTMVPATGVIVCSSVTLTYESALHLKSVSVRSNMIGGWGLSLALSPKFSPLMSRRIYLTRCLGLMCLIPFPSLVRKGIYWITSSNACTTRAGREAVQMIPDSVDTKECVCFVVEVIYPCALERTFSGASGSNENSSCRSRTNVPTANLL